MNTGINVYEDGIEPGTRYVVCGDSAHQENQGKPILEIQPGGFIYGCVFQKTDGKADRILNG